MQKGDGSPWPAAQPNALRQGGGSEISIPKRREVEADVQRLAGTAGFSRSHTAGADWRALTAEFMTRAKTLPGPTLIKIAEGP